MIAIAGALLSGACNDRDRAAPPPQHPDVPLVPVPAEIAAHVALKPFVTGLARPVLLTTAPGDPATRMYVVEQRGTIRTIDSGVVSTDPMIDLHGQLSGGGEQGLLGLAFHPDYATNHKLYLDFTSIDGHTHVVEYRLAADGKHLDLATARQLVEIPKRFANHNGGNLLFGPDRKLYLGTGDGGSAGDPDRNGQNPRALLAKILRFDVDNPAAPPPPPEVVDLGVRNPWRYWFDKPTGDLYIGDVGQDLWESIYVISGEDHRVHNFGWNVMEGNHCFKADQCDHTGFTPPVVDYPHTEGCSVTGGVTYRGKALPQLEGRYFYADYCTGLLRSFAWTRDPNAALGAPTGKARDHWDWKAAIDRDGMLAQISSFGVDADGEVYILLLTGTILELVPRA